MLGLKMGLTDERRIWYVRVPHLRDAPPKATAAPPDASVFRPIQIPVTAHPERHEVRQAGGNLPSEDGQGRRGHDDAAHENARLRARPTPVVLQHARPRQWTPQW